MSDFDQTVEEVKQLAAGTPPDASRGATEQPPEMVARKREPKGGRDG